MAVRTVFLNFTSNVGTLTSTFSAAAVAHRALAAAESEASAARAKAAPISADLANREQTLNRLRNEAKPNIGAIAATETGLNNARARAAPILSDLQAKEDSAAQARTKSSDATVQAGAVLGKFAVVAGAGLTVALGESVKAAEQFQNQMAQVGVAGNLSATQLRVMSAAVLDMSTRIPVATGELATALVEIEREGFAGADAINVLQAASMGAVATMGSVTDVTRNLVQVLDAFQGQGVTAAGVMDLLVVGTEHSQASLDDFAKALSQVGPVAGLLKVPITDLTAAIMQMTREGLNAQQAGMSLNRFMLQTIKPGTDLEAAVRTLTNAQNKNGFASGAMAIQTLGLTGVMQGLIEKTGGSVAQLEKLYPSVRAFRGVAALAIDGGSGFAHALSEVSDQTKVAQEAQDAYQRQAGTFSNQMKLTKNDIHATAVELGTALLPAVQWVATAVGGAFQVFNGWSSGMKTATAVAAALAAGILLIGGAMAMLIPVLGTLGLELDLAFPEVAAIGLAVGAVIAGITAVIGIASHAAAEHKKLVDQYKTAYMETGDAATAAAQAQAQQNLIAGKAAATLTSYGISLKDAVGAITDLGNTTGATTRITGDMLAQMGLTESQVKSLGGSTGDWNQIQKDAQRTVEGGKGGRQDLQSDILRLTRGNEALSQSYQKGIGILAAVGAQRQAAGAGYQKAKQETQDLSDAQAENNTSYLMFGVAADKSSGAMSRLTAQQQQAIDSLDTMGTSLQSAIQGFTGIAAIEQAAGGATLSYASASAVATQAMQDQKNALNEQADALAASQSAGQDAASQALQNAKDAATANNNALADAAASNGAFGVGASASVSSAVGNSQVSAGLAKQNAAAAKEGAKDAKQATTAQLQDQSQALAEQKKTDAAAVKAARDRATDYKLTAADWITAMHNENQTVSDNNTILARIAASGHVKLAGELRGMGKDGLSIIAEFGKGWSSTFDASGNVVQKFSDTTVAAMNDAENSITGLNQGAQIGFEQFNATMASQSKDQADWIANLTKLAAAGELDLVQQLADMGVKGSAAAAQAVGDLSTEAGRKTLETANSNASVINQYAGKTGAQIAQALVENMTTITTQGGTDAGMKAMTAFANNSMLSDADKAQISSQLISAFEQAGTAAGKAGAVAVEAAMAQATTGNVPVNLKIGITNEDWAKMTPEEQKNLIGMNRSQSEGSILSFYAEGHVAQIAPAGAMRVWAEPETGGEAYIPMSPAKRGRSTAIWAAVGREFGYQVHNADGNVLPAGSPMVGGVSQHQQGAVQVVTVPQKVSQTTAWEFNGPIQGYSLEQVQRDADNKKRLASLKGLN